MLTAKLRRESHLKNLNPRLGMLLFLLLMRLESYISIFYYSYII